MALNILKMPAFTRDLLCRPQCAIKIPRLLLQPHGHCQPPRLFSNTPLLSAKPKKSSSKKVKSEASRGPRKLEIQDYKPPTSGTATSHAPEYQSYADSLARKTSPTLLYAAQSHAAFFATAYCAAGFCFSWGAFNFHQHFLYPPAGLDPWVPYGFGVVSFMMLGAAGYLTSGPSKLIKSISAIPPSCRALHGKDTSQLQLEIVLRRMIAGPFYDNRKIYVNPHQVSFERPLVIPSLAGTSKAELMEMERREAQALKEREEYEKSHILTHPFRAAGRAFAPIFKATARIWTHGGFLKCKIEGHGTFKLDVTGSPFALDGGRAIDRLTVRQADMRRQGLAYWS